MSCREGLSIKGTSCDGKPGSPHVRHDYSILRRERAKGCAFQVVEAGIDFGRVRLAGNGGVWKVAGTAQRLIPELFDAHRRIAGLTTPDRRLGEIGEAEATLWPGRIAPLATAPT